ncbi:unnamed protein product [Colias eurytheme]|nr:unnamed protein product [Colias eurytheme]
MLNSDGTGDSRTEEKWRKVWSDFKNNVKKKWAKINRSAQGTGGGPAIQLTLTDLENRVLNLIGVQAATGMPIQEAGFVQVVGGEDVSLSGVQAPATETVDELTGDDAAYEYTPIPEDAQKRKPLYRVQAKTNRLEIRRLRSEICRKKELRISNVKKRRKSFLKMSLSKEL